MSIPRFIDCDCHVTEPPDTWTDRMASKWGDLVPHVRRVTPEEATQLGALATTDHDAWFSGDQPLSLIGATAGEGWPEPLPSVPRTIDDIIPAAYDAKKRLELMDSRNCAAQVLYPNVAGFGSPRFRDLPGDLGLECVRAYNDFLLDWVEPDPGRFVPVASLPYWDISATVSEIERIADRGMKAVIFPGTPHDWGQPYLASREWDPVWSAAQDAGISISFHAGSGNFTALQSPERDALETFEGGWTRASSQILLFQATQVADLVMSGILPRFPELTFVSVESGIGWIPFLRESLDHQFKAMKVHKHRPEFEELPSYYWRRQVKVCYWFEQSAPRHLVDDIGADTILFESDFPHPICLTDDQIKVSIEEYLGSVPEEDRNKILFENAAQLYGIDRELCVPA